MQHLHQQIKISDLDVLGIKTEKQCLVPHTGKARWGAQLVLCK